MKTEKYKWHWMSFKKPFVIGALMEYLNASNIIDFKFVEENKNYKFYIFKTHGKEWIAWVDKEREPE